MTCKTCKGTGETPPYKDFEKLRLERESLGISLADVAAYLNVTSGHLHDMEHGRRKMSTERMESYKKALKK